MVDFDGENGSPRDAAVALRKNLVLAQPLLVVTADRNASRAGAARLSWHRFLASLIN